MTSTMKWAALVAVAVVYGAALVMSNEDDIDLDLPDVPGPKLSDIPGFENLGIDESALPKAEEIEKLLKQKCEQAGGENAFETAKNARPEAEKCVRSLINTTALMIEMETAKPTGNLDEVFKSYCRKSPALKNCVMDFVNSSSQCLNPEERKSGELVQNVTEQLLGFVCFKEGDRIALFIAEKGPECLTDKKEAVLHCVNATFGKRLAGGTPSIQQLPQLILGAEQCQDVCALRRCVVNELEKCSEPTPANIVQAMFDYILKVTPCVSCKGTTGATSGAITGSSSNSVKYDYFTFVFSTIFLLITSYNLAN